MRTRTRLSEEESLEEEGKPKEEDEEDGLSVAEQGTSNG